MNNIEDEISGHAMIDHSMQVSLCAGPLVGSNMDLPEQPPSNSQPADPGLCDSQPADPRLSDSQPADPGFSDSQPADPGLSDSEPAEQNQAQDSAGQDEEMQAQEGPKPGMQDVLLIPQRKLSSVSLSMFFVILLWDVLGTPRPNVNPVRSFYESLSNHH